MTYTVKTVPIKDLKTELDAVDAAPRTLVQILPGPGTGRVTIVSKA